MQYVFYQFLLLVFKVFPFSLIEFCKVVMFKHRIQYV